MNCSAREAFWSMWMWLCIDLYMRIERKKTPSIIPTIAKITMMMTSRAINTPTTSPPASSEEGEGGHQHRMTQV